MNALKTGLAGRIVLLPGEEFALTPPTSSAISPNTTPTTTKNAPSSKMIADTVIVVANPKLLDAECKTPAQLRLANALCRYVEMSGSAEGQRVAVSRA